MRNIHKLFNAVVFVFGMLFLAGNLAYGQVSVGLPNVSGQVGQAKVVPMTVGSLTGQGVTAVSFTITYDKTVVNIAGVSTTGTILDAYKSNLVVNTTVAGKITVAAAGTSALTAAGTLINLNITPLTVGASDLAISDFSFNEGTPAASLTNGSFSVPSLSISVADTSLSAPVGGNISFPVQSGDMTGKAVTAYTFTVTYDPTIISLTGYTNAGTLSSGISQFAVNATVPGKLTISAAGTSALTGKGVLLNLTGKAVKAGTSAIAFSDVLFNEGTPVVGSVDGSVTILANVKPAFTQALKDTSINEGAAFAFTYKAVDPNVEAVTYAAIGTLPTGATLDGATGAFAWTPSYTQSGVYTIVVKATDALGLYDSTKAVITVKNVNRKPVFSSFLKDTTILQYKAFAFTYKATDPDTGGVTYSLAGATPRGMSIDPATGLVTWAWNSTQPGTYTITVRATDISGAFENTTANLTVSISTGVDGLTSAVPTEYSLGQNYPNPFNPSTSIKFGLPKAAPVTLEIYNVLGEKVATLLNGTMMSASFHSITWNGKNENGGSVASGMYLYRISADKYVQTMKMLLMK